MFKLKALRKSHTFPAAASLESPAPSTPPTWPKSKIQPHWQPTQFQQYVHPQVVRFKVESLFPNGEFHIQFVDSQIGGERNLCVWAFRELSSSEKEDIRITSLQAHGQGRPRQRSPWLNS